jgi:hypothetical protein
MVDEQAAALRITKCCRLRSLRSLRPTWPLGDSGLRTSCNVFSGRRLKQSLWWATSATQERYMTSLVVAEPSM